MSDFKLKGPYETEIKVSITDGKQEGDITVSLTTGEPPVQADIDKCLALAKEKAETAGFRLMNKREFFHKLCRQKLGIRERIAMPGGSEEWDK